MSSAPFEMIVPVLPGDIDEQNHVNNTVYLRWVQDVATAHWRAVASPEAQRPSPGSLSDTRSTTKLPLACRKRSFCAPGSAKPVALRSNGSRKSGATTTDCSYQRLG